MNQEMLEQGIILNFKNMYSTLHQLKKVEYWIIRNNISNTYDFLPLHIIIYIRFQNTELNVFEYSLKYGFSMHLKDYQIGEEQ